MAHLRLHYLQAFVDRRTGAVYHYFRRRGYPRLRLPGLPGSAEFMAAYQEALAQGQPPIGTERSKPGTVAAAVAAYFVSIHFTEFAAGTQAMRRAILNRFRDQHGDKPLGLMPSEFIALLLGKMKPHAARNWFKCIRALCQFAVDIKMIKADPTQGMKRPKAKTKGRRAWTDNEVEQYESAHPIGTKARLAFALGLCTLQRNSDVIRMGRQHIKDGLLAVRQKKTGTTLALPVRPELQNILDATPSEHLTFLVNKNGKPYNSKKFSDLFRVWCNEAGLPVDCTFHGLRATGCTRLADEQCTTHEIAAWSGHMSLQEVERYTRSANQKRLAVSALARLTRAK